MPAYAKDDRLVFLYQGEGLVTGDRQPNGR